MPAEKKKMKHLPFIYFFLTVLGRLLPPKIVLNNPKATNSIIRNTKGVDIVQIIFWTEKPTMYLVMMHLYCASAVTQFFSLLLRANISNL